jgi:hypothetical protein
MVNKTEKYASILQNLESSGATINIIIIEIHKNKHSCFLSCLLISLPPLLFFL